MSNQLTDPTRNEFLTGARSWLTGTYKLALMSADYVFDTAHAFLDDVATDAIAGATLTGLTAVDGVADADDLTGGTAITGVTAGTDYLGMWVYEDSGSPATSPLIAWLDTMDDDTPLGGTANGLPIAVVWPALGVFKL